MTHEPHELRITQAAEGGTIAVLIDGHDISNLTNYLTLNISPGGADLTLTVTLSGLDIELPHNLKARLDMVTLEDLWTIGDYPESVADLEP